MVYKTNKLPVLKNLHFGGDRDAWVTVEMEKAVLGSNK